MMSRERQLAQKIKQGLIGITPGVKVQAFHKGKLALQIDEGQTSRFYDWASLTKIVFSSAILMNLVSEKKLNLHQSIADYLPWYPYSRPIWRFMAHAAGLPWWKPFYQHLDLKAEPFERWFELSNLIKPLHPTTIKKCVYSDLDLFLLAYVYERLWDRRLPEIWPWLSERYELEGLHFNLNNSPKYSRSLYAKTEKCLWRKKVMQGEVHDENTWALGGLAPHAGLFGRIEDLANWGLMLRAAYRGDKSRLPARSEVVRRFVKRAVPKSSGDWGLGFMVPTMGSASCGRYFSQHSFGHTGFTGTSLWYDPKKDLLVVILSNRVHPTRENKRFLQFRPQMHDWVCEALDLI